MMAELNPDLKAYALRAGATAVKFISPEKLVVEKSLARLCLEPRCPNYGLSASCPPHVQGPEQFRNWCEDAEHALALKIDVPVTVLYSAARVEVMQLLHEIVAGTEQYAVKLKYPNALGFAGGSCRQIFCRDELNCLYLSKEKQCRHPLSARPSLSGFGVNVAAMVDLAGWEASTLFETDSQDQSMSWVVGLVLLRP